MKINSISSKTFMEYLVICYFMLIFFVEVPYIKTLIYISSNGLNFMKIIAICLCFLYKKKNQHYSCNYLVVLIMYATIFVSTYFVSGAMISAVGSISLSIAVCTLITFCNEEQMLKIFGIWKIEMIIFLLIDLYTFYKYPLGLFVSRTYSSNWFLGYKTERLVYLFPLLVMSAYIDATIKKKITAKTFIIGALILADNILASGSTATFALTIFFCFLIFVNFFYSKKKNYIKVEKVLYTICDYKFVILLYIILFYIIVIIPENNWIKTVIADFFGKSLTFSNRTYIWTRVLNEYKKYPIMGVGIFNTVQYEAMTGLTGGSNAHNFILSILLSGGAVGLLEIIMLHILALRKKNHRYSMDDVIMVGSIYVLMLLGFVSSTLVYSWFTYVPFIILSSKRIKFRK